MLDIFFYEAFKEEETALKRFLPKKFKAGFTWKTIQEKGDVLPPARILSIRTHSRIPASWANELKGILSRSQGYDHLLAYKQETKTNIPCGYLRDYCSRAVAEHAIMAMMMLLRKIKLQIRQFNEFKRDNITGAECKNRKVLVVGVGRIGSQIADIAKGLKMEVKGVDINPKKKGIGYVSFKKGIKWADIIFSAVPLTKKTERLFTRESLSFAKKGVIFINISRGEVSPTKDMRSLIEDKILGCLSLDVYEQEKDLADFFRKKDLKQNKKVKDVMFLKDQDNVLFTPHNAFNTKEAVEEKAAQTMASIFSFLKKKRFLNPVPNK